MLTRTAAHRSTTLLDRSRRQLMLLLAAVLALSGLVMVSSGPAQAASGQVAGVVFRDFNSNGVKDTNAASTGIASDVGLAGVTVTATDNHGNLLDSAVSSSTGTYTLDIADPAIEDVRVDFTGLPAGYESSFHGSGNGTSTQFVKVSGASVTGVNFAVNAPEDYSQSVPAPIVTAIQGAGLRSDPANATKPSLVSIPWSAARNDSPTSGDYSVRTTLGLVKDTGSLWGAAFQKSTGDLFTSATLRRHADLGPLGLGGIYWVEDALKADGTINTAAATASPWLDVTDLGIDVGTVPSAATRGLTAPSQPARDVEAYGKIGKVGIGGITVSSDNKLLYFVNLFDKKLYAINIADKTLAATYNLNLAADERPWAVTVHRGKAYIGYAQTGEGVTPTPAAADLDMVVRAASESSLASLGASSAEVLRHDLGYTRGNTYGSSVDARFKQWHAWTDVWNTTNFTFVNWPGTSWAQAQLSDLQFTTQGDLILGLQDRFSLQSGNRNYSPDTSNNNLYEAVALGDILIAGPDGSGGFTLESNGTVSGRTTTAGSNNEGPGGREFFNDGNVYQSGGASHHENSLGGLATLAGIDQVAATTFDPTSVLRTSGNTWFSTVNGSVAKGYQHSADGGTSAGSFSGNFQKAGGLGDIQALTNLAPLEIGNRVWFDADQDGIQDADEPPVAGVKVELFAADEDGNPTGAPISSTTTNSTGNYYFNADPNREYVVVFTTPTSGNWVTNDPTFGTVKWADISFTDQPVGGTTATDSNVNASGEAYVETGGPGHNDHTIDAGLVANTSFTVEKLIDEDGGDPAAGQTYTISLDAKDFRGDTLALTQSSLTLDADVPSDPIVVPVGTRIKVTEDDEDDYDSVTIGAASGTADADGYYLVQGGSTAFAFTVTNKLFMPGTFEVTKAVTGDFTLDSSALDAVEFTVHYAYAGGSGDLVLKKSNGWKLESSELPYGETVTLSEPTISNTPANVSFTTPKWQVGAGTVTTSATTTFTVGNGTKQSIALTNPSTELYGTFDLTKKVVGAGADRVPEDTEFVAEYKIGNGAWTELDPMGINDTVHGPAEIPAGTKVLIREQAPDTLDDVDWVLAVFSGTGVTPATDTEPASFVIGADATLDVTLTNTTEKIDGQFKITKDVTGPGENLLEDDTEFTVNWTLGGVAQEPIVLTNGSFFTSAPIATGSEVEITEVTPTAGLPTGASWGTPVLVVDDEEQANGATFTIGDDENLLAIVLKNPTDVEPSVEITKGDGDADEGLINHEADTVTGGEYYKDGETRDIVIKVKNTGPEPLRKVTLTDLTRSGGEIVDLEWTFPDGSKAAANWDADDAQWTAIWAATFDPDTTTWAVGDVITGTAKLTVNASDKPHQDRVRVDAEGAYSGKPVDDSDDYNAFSAAIQVIKYDGNKTDPVVKDGEGNWVVPTKPLADVAQDANDAAHAVSYTAGKQNKVRWVVTNTGSTTLTQITLADVTGAGPDIGSDWTANLSEFGGPADYSFVKDGPWNGLFPPGASFFSRGTLTLPADSAHNDTVTVTGVPVIPAEGDDGKPSDEPWLVDGEPQLVRDGEDNPIVLTDDDPFYAKTPAKVPTGTLPEDEDDPEAAPGPAPEDEPGLLPDAGSGMGPWAPLGGLLLLVAGATAVFAAKRRDNGTRGGARRL